jgi:segregation and condensation protein A
MNDTQELEKNEGYRIKLPMFEGPLDLLLYLIRKEEIDIYDIPIASITQQYLEYIGLMQELDLEVAGEFILMAATLIQIKVRMLLPKHELEGEEIDEEDPRAELVRQILEYKRYKEIAESFQEMETRQSRFFERSNMEWEKHHFHEEEEEPLVTDVTLFDLLTAFKHALEQMPQVTDHAVSAAGPSIEERIDYLVRVLDERDRIMFRDLMAEIHERVTVIVTFLAMLELIRTHRIIVRQNALFGEIWILKTGALIQNDAI